MLLIIDGNNLAHRARHTFNLSHKGVDTSTTYGFLHIFSSLLRKFTPSSVIVCWDGGTPEYRRRMLPEYKANRKRGDPEEYADFVRQLQELSRILPMMGVISARKIGAEADDLMFHASRISNIESVIVTTDVDLLQAVCAGVLVYSPTKQKMFGQRDISNGYGVEPLTLVHLRALAGDSSDNISGVQGIGMKTAIKLFQKYGSLSGIMNAALGCNPAGKIEGKMKARILDFGMDKLTANVAVMALAFDRVGARLALADAIEDFQSVDKGHIRKYLVHNAFGSLLDSPFIGKLANLCMPPIYTRDMRMPVACWQREATNSRLGISAG